MFIRVADDIISRCLIMCAHYSVDIYLLIISETVYKAGASGLSRMRRHATSSSRRPGTVYTVFQRRVPLK